MGDINELHNLLQSLHPKIKFSIEHSSKELLFLDVLIKKPKMPKSSQTSTTNPQTPNNTSTSIVTTPKTA